MAWWRRNGRKRAPKGANGTNGTTPATRITGDDVLDLVAAAPHPSAARGATAGGAAPEAAAVATVDVPPDAPAAPPPPIAFSPPPPPAAAPAPVPPTATDGQLVPLSPLRRRTGEHMARSRAIAAHALTLVEVDLDRVERARGNAGLEPLAFVARAVVDALARLPHLNASVEDDGLHVHRAVHLGLTVDLDHHGLAVPVVRDADGKRLRALAAEAADLRARARSGGLGPDDLLGATFTINEPDTYAALLSVPIIHQPQVAILAVGGVQRRPVAVPLPDGGDAIAVHPVALLALSWDHRAFDGAYASAFLACVRDILETRDWEAEL